MKSVINYEIYSNNLKKKISYHKQKLNNEKNFSNFFVSLVDEKIKEKINSKNYKIKSGFLILEFDILGDIIKIKFNKYKNKISIYINNENILNTNMKHAIMNIIKKYEVDIV